MSHRVTRLSSAIELNRRASWRSDKGELLKEARSPSCAGADGGYYSSVPTRSAEDDEDLRAEQAAFHERMCRDNWLEFIESTQVQVIVGMLIFFNALVIGLETDMPSAFSWDIFENTMLVLFVSELLIKIALAGARDFFDWECHDFYWNLFDVTIVSLGASDFLLTYVFGWSTGGFATIFRILRLLRILRIFRIVRSLKQLYLIAFGFGEAARAIIWVTVFMGFALYVCSVIMARTIGRPEHSDPNHDFLVEHFGSVLHSMFTLFMLMAAPDLRKYQEQNDVLWQHPGLLVFLCCFILFGSFGLIALLTGVISESMFEKNHLRRELALLDKEHTRQHLVQNCNTLFDTLETNSEGEADLEDIEVLLPMLGDVMREQGVECTQKDLEHIVEYMDTDHNGSVSWPEFIHAVLFQAEGVRPLSMQEMHFDVSWCKHKLEKLTVVMDKLMERILGPDAVGPTHSGLTPRSRRRRSAISRASDESDKERHGLDKAAACGGAEAPPSDGPALPRAPPLDAPPQSLARRQRVSLSRHSLAAHEKRRASAAASAVGPAEALDQWIANAFIEHRDFFQAELNRQVERLLKDDALGKLEFLDRSIAHSFAEHQEILERMRKMQTEGLQRVQTVLHEELSAIGTRVGLLSVCRSGHKDYDGSFIEFVSDGEGRGGEESPAASPGPAYAAPVAPDRRAAGRSPPPPLDHGAPLHSGSSTSPGRRRRGASPTTPASPSGAPARGATPPHGVSAAAAARVPALAPTLAPPASAPPVVGAATAAAAAGGLASGWPSAGAALGAAPCEVPLAGSGMGAALDAAPGAAPGAAPPGDARWQRRSALTPPRGAPARGQSAPGAGSGAGSATAAGAAEAAEAAAAAAGAPGAVAVGGAQGGASRERPSPPFPGGAGPGAPA